MAEVLTLPKARVPVVKFVVPKTGTKVCGCVGGGMCARGVCTSCADGNNTRAGRRHSPCTPTTPPTHPRTYLHRWM